MNLIFLVTILSLIKINKIVEKLAKLLDIFKYKRDYNSLKL